MTSPGDTVCDDEKFGYRYKTRHSSSQRGDSRGYVGRYVSKSEISTNLPCSMLEKGSITTREVDLGIKQALLPPIIEMILVHNQVFIFMAMVEVEIGLRQANILHITMVE